jgi:hypothetical protein
VPIGARSDHPITRVPEELEPVSYVPVPPPESGEAIGQVFFDRTAEVLRSGIVGAEEFIAYIAAPWTRQSAGIYASGNSLLNNSPQVQVTTIAGAQVVNPTVESVLASLKATGKLGWIVGGLVLGIIVLGD